MHNRVWVGYPLVLSLPSVAMHISPQELQGASQRMGYVPSVLTCIKIVSRRCDTAMSRSHEIESAVSSTPELCGLGLVCLDWLIVDKSQGWCRCPRGTQATYGLTGQLGIGIWEGQ